MNNVQKFLAMEKALKVYLLTPTIYHFLRDTDPKMLEQIEHAIDSPKIIKQAEERSTYWCSHRQKNTYSNNKIYPEYDLIGCLCFEPSSTCPANKKRSKEI